MYSSELTHFQTGITAHSIRFIWKEAAATKWWQKPGKSELGKRGHLVLPNRGGDIGYLSLHEAGRPLNLTAICEDNDRLGNWSPSHKDCNWLLVTSVTRVRDGSMYTPNSVLSFYHRMLKGRREEERILHWQRSQNFSFIATLNSRSPKNFFFF